MKGGEGGWMGSNRAQRTSLCELTALCVCTIGKLVCFWRKVTVCGERNPEHGCLPGCCSLGPLTGTFYIIQQQRP